jgi:hypothetical protein
MDDQGELIMLDVCLLMGSAVAGTAAFRGAGAS